MSPKQGDVIFTLSKDITAIPSCFMQYFLDPAAAAGLSWFSHVSIMIDESFVLEAVSEDKKDTEGKLTGIPLNFGVRIKPLPDVLYPDTRNIVVMRNKGFLNIPSKKKKILDIVGPIIPTIMGSGYSIKKLKDSADTWVFKSLKWIDARSGFFDWNSSPEDLATKLGIDVAFREKLETSFAPHIFSDIPSKTYFCSELVIDFLKLLNLVGGNYGNNVSTPSGLFEQLKKDSNWCDVTSEDYLAGRVKTLSPYMIEEWNIKYMSQIGFLKSAQASIVTQKMIDALAAACNSINVKADSIIAKYVDGDYGR